MSEQWQNYQTLVVTRQENILQVVVDAPPINVMTARMFAELRELIGWLEDPGAEPHGVQVVIFKSADPDFFIAHFDVERLLNLPVEGEPQREATLSVFHTMCERLQQMPVVSIAQIEGRVGGGGSELAANMDMRFGVFGKTVVNQMEVPIGILPGGSGTQRLPHLLGRGRAMEVILGGVDIDAETAERWGYLNRLFSADAIDDAVMALARRIASFPSAAVASAKASINAAALPGDAGLIEESVLFQQLLRTATATEAMQAFLQAGGQTRAGELRVAELMAPAPTKAD